MASLKELKNFFENSELNISFGWINKSTFGIFDPSKEKIIINIYLSIADIFIHEFLHYKYPQLSEKKIKKKTENFLNRLTVPEIKKMAKYLLKNTIWK